MGSFLRTGQMDKPHMRVVNGPRAGEWMTIFWDPLPEEPIQLPGGAMAEEKSNQEETPEERAKREKENQSVSIPEVGPGGETPQGAGADLPGGAAGGSSGEGGGASQGGGSTGEGGGASQGGGTGNP